MFKTVSNLSTACCECSCTLLQPWQPWILENSEVKLLIRKTICSSLVLLKPLGWIQERPIFLLSNSLWVLLLEWKEYLIWNSNIGFKDRCKTYMILCKSFNISKLQFPHLYYWDNYLRVFS